MDCKEGRTRTETVVRHASEPRGSASPAAVGWTAPVTAPCAPLITVRPVAPAATSSTQLPAVVADPVSSTLTVCGVPLQRVTPNVAVGRVKVTGGGGGGGGGTPPLPGPCGQWPDD